MSNLKQIATALVMYTQDYDEMLPLYNYLGAGGTSQFNALQVLYPYIKSQQVFICPSAQKYSTAPYSSNATTFVLTSYNSGGSYGYNYAYLNPVYQKAQSIAAISLVSETIAYGEITGACTSGQIYPPSLWSGTSSYCYKPDGTGGESYGNHEAYLHLEGSNYAFVDGHVKWLKKSSVSGPAGCTGAACDVLWGKIRNSCPLFCNLNSILTV